MLRRGPPENVLAAIMIGDQRMLQAEPIGYGANARSFESPLGKFRNGGIEDRGPRLDRTLLFGSLARALPAPISQPCFLRHLTFVAPQPTATRSVKWLFRSVSQPAEWQEPVTVAMHVALSLHEHLPSIPKSSTIASVHQIFAVGSFSFEDQRWRFNVLVKGLCR